MRDGDSISVFCTATVMFFDNQTTNGKVSFLSRTLWLDGIDDPSFYCIFRIVIDNWQWFYKALDRHLALEHRGR